MERSRPFLMGSATTMDDAHCCEPDWPCGAPAPATLCVYAHLADSRYNSVHPGVPVPRCGGPLAAMVPSHDHRQVYREETRSAYARVARMAACLAQEFQGFLFQKQRACLARLSLITRPSLACAPPGMSAGPPVPLR